MLTRHGRTFAVSGVVLVVVGASLGYRELVVLGLIAGACLLVAVVWMTNRPELQVVREITPGRVVEGDPARGVLTVTNVGGRRSAPLVASEPVADGRVHVIVPSLPPQGSHAQSYQLPTVHRGCYPVGPLTVSSSDPLRLLAADNVSGAEAHLWVHPRSDRVKPLPIGRAQEWDGPTSAGAPRGGVAFHSLREYQPGDDLRLIHWRSTAKSGRLVDAPDRDTWTGRRDHALLDVAAQTGLRVSELTALRNQDMQLSAGPHLRCTGKGGKDRATPLTKETVAVLKVWMHECRGDPSDPLFPTRRGTPLSRHAVEDLVAEHTAAAARRCPSLRTKHPTPHVLRHSCVISPAFSA